MAFGCSATYSGYSVTAPGYLMMTFGTLTKSSGYLMADSRYSISSGYSAMTSECSATCSDLAASPHDYKIYSDSPSCRQIDCPKKYLLPYVIKHERDDFSSGSSTRPRLNSQYCRLAGSKPSDHIKLSVYIKLKASSSTTATYKSTKTS
jgi:hypothetical protein